LKTYRLYKVALVGLFLCISGYKAVAKDYGAAGSCTANGRTVNWCIRGSMIFSELSGPSTGTPLPKNGFDEAVGELKNAYLRSDPGDEDWTITQNDKKGYTIKIGNINYVGSCTTHAHGVMERADVINLCERTLNPGAHGPN